MSTDLVPLSKFPWAWEETVPVANPKCGGCPQAAKDSHLSCAAFKANAHHLPTLSQKFDLTDFRRMEYLLFRKARDASGLYGSEDGFQYNAADSYNASDFVSATIISASGMTLVVDFGVDPRQLVLWQARRPSPSEDAPFTVWIPGFGGIGPPRPNMVVQYGPESILALKSKPTIKEVLDLTGTRMTFRLGQNCDHALTPLDPEYAGAFNCFIWNQDGNNNLKRLQIQDATYFRGHPKTKQVKADSLPENKIYALESTGVAHPPGFVSTPEPVFWIEGFRKTAPLEWETISGSESRLFTRTHIDNSRDAVVAFGTAKPDYANDPEGTLPDLIDSYSQFRIHYWKEGGAIACEVPCFNRCKEARRYVPGDIRKYNPADGAGVGFDADGKSWYCRARKYPKYTYQDLYDAINRIPGEDGVLDTLITEYLRATRAFDFPANGQCLNYNTCDKFKASENDRGLDAIWDERWHGALFFYMMWAASGWKLVQQLPGESGTWNFIATLTNFDGIQYIANVSLRSEPTTAIFEAKVEFIKPGLWHTGVDTITDDDGNTHFRDRWQHNWDATIDPETEEQVLGAGRIPSGVTGFSTSRDPLDYAGTIEGNEIERFGVGNLRDDGAIVGRGIHDRPKLLPEGQVIIPNIDKSVTDPQDRTIAVFTIDPEPVDLNGDGSFMRGAMTEFIPLRHDGVSLTQFASREIFSAELGTGGTVICYLRNTLHTFTFLGSTPQTNEYVNWFAGGGPGFAPTDPYIIDGHDEPDKTIGSPVRGVQPGDTATISGFEGYMADARFCVANGTGPFLGPEAPGWGDTTVTNVDFEVGGFFKAASGNTLVGSDHKAIKAPDSGDFVKEGSTVYTRVLEDATRRPDVLHSHEFYVDGDRIYLSPDNDGANLTIHYGVEGKTDQYTESYTVATSPVMPTGIDYAKWTGADVRKVYFYGTHIEITDYISADASGLLTLQFNGNIAGRRVTVHLEKSGTVSDPGNHCLLAATYEGKKMDKVVLRDETGWLQSNVDSLAGKSINFSYGGAAYWPDGLQPQFAEYTTETWNDLADGVDIVSEHGRGRWHHSVEWLIAAPPVFCLKG
jgi:hypothetical protein